MATADPGENPGYSTVTSSFTALRVNDDDQRSMAAWKDGRPDPSTCTQRIEGNKEPSKDTPRTGRGRDSAWQTGSGAWQNPHGTTTLCRPKCSRLSEGLWNPYDSVTPLELIGGGNMNRKGKVLAPKCKKNKQTVTSVGDYLKFRSNTTGRGKTSKRLDDKVFSRLSRKSRIVRESKAFVYGKQFLDECDVVPCSSGFNDSSLESFSPTASMRRSLCGGEAALLTPKSSSLSDGVSTIEFTPDNFWYTQNQARLIDDAMNGYEVDFPELERNEKYLQATTLLEQPSLYKYKEESSVGRTTLNYWGRIDESDSEASEVEDFAEPLLEHFVEKPVADYWGEVVGDDTILETSLVGMTLSRRVSQLNGNNGSWTNTDDVDDKINEVRGKSGQWYGHLHLSYFDMALCSCVGRDHVHIRDPERITHAHKAFLKRRQKRDENKPQGDAKGKKDDVRAQEKKKSDNVRFGFDDCTVVGCKAPHLHVSNCKFELNSEFCIPASSLRDFGDPIDDEDDIEMKTSLGEEYRTESHIAVVPNNARAPDNIRGDSRFVMPAGQASEMKFLVSDGVVNYGVRRIGVVPNDGNLMVGGVLRKNCCFFTSMALLLNHAGHDVDAVGLRDVYFPDHKWGDMVELGVEAVDNVGRQHAQLLALLHHYDMTLNIWLDCSSSNGPSRGWRRFGDFTYGVGRKAVSVMMNSAHFEPIVWFECARLADNGLFSGRTIFRTHTSVNYKHVRAYRAHGDALYQGEVLVGWHITTVDHASTFWIGQPPREAVNVPLVSATQKMAANGGKPTDVLSEHIDEIIASEEGLRQNCISDDDIPADILPRPVSKVLVDPYDLDLISEGVILTDVTASYISEVVNDDAPPPQPFEWDAAQDDLDEPKGIVPVAVPSTPFSMNAFYGGVLDNPKVDPLSSGVKPKPLETPDGNGKDEPEVIQQPSDVEAVHEETVRGSQGSRSDSDGSQGGPKPLLGLYDTLRRGLNLDVQSVKLPLFTKKDKKAVVKQKPLPFEVSCDDSLGHYLDKARIDDVMMNMTEVICSNRSFFQEIEDFVQSFIRRPVAYALPERSDGSQHSLKLDMHFESEPTFLWKVLTFNTAKAVKVKKPKSTVQVLDGVYTSSMRAFVWLDLCEILLKDASSIGSLANQEFWTWCVPKYRAKVQSLNPEYFSGRLAVVHDVDGHVNHSYNSITCNTICYLIALEAISVGKISLSIPTKIGIAKTGKSSFAASKKVFSVGGVDTFMGVIKANRLISEGVAVNEGVLKQGSNYTIRSTYEPRAAGVYSEGFTRILPMKCSKPMDWEFNQRYRIHKGKRHVVDGKLNFPNDTDEDLFEKMNYSHRYISVYGYAFANSGMVYGTHNDNIARMLERHWKKREPEGIEETALKEYGFSAANFDMKLLAQQCYFAHYLGTDFIDDTLRDYGNLEYFTDIQEAASYLILEKHAKQELRVDSFNDIMNTGEIGLKIFKPYLVWKLKQMEIAKPKKAPRAIVDAQTANSLPNVHISNAWKKHSADRVVVYSDLVSIEFCSCPAPADLEVVFKSWDEYSYDVVVKNYSDDSIIGLWNQGLGRYDMYNTDIRANDGSHSGWTWSVFSNLLKMPTDHSEFLLNMIFTENYVLARNKKDRIAFKSCYGYLPSGIGSTSIANNTVMLMISWMLARFIKAGHRLSLSLVTIAAFRCGFLLSFEKFDLSQEYSKMQFLKYSPVRVASGNVIVIPNLGRMLRYSGRSKNDVTVKQYQPPLVNGVQVNVFKWYQTLLTYGDFKRVYYPPLVSALCPYFHLVDDRHYDMIVKIDEDRVLNDLRSEVRLFPTREQFYSRYYLYGATDAMIDEFEGLIALSTLGTLVYSPFVDLVLNADYGLAPVST